MATLEASKLDKLKSEYADSILEINTDNYNRISIIVQPDAIKSIAQVVHDKLEFFHANFCMATDLEEKIEVAWYIGNQDYQSIISLKVLLDRENPEVDTLSDLWEGMNWHERETFEMLGVIFKGHEDLRRLILPDSWEGYPLRNDYIYNKPSYRKPEDELMS